MGAEFLLYMLPACKLTDERRAVLVEIYSHLTDEEQQHLVDCSLLDDDDGNMADDALAPANLLKLFGEAMDVYADYWVDSSREITNLTIDGRLFYATGGMSWGDRPNDAATVLEKLGAVVRVWDRLNSWALHDYLREVCKDFLPDLDERRQSVLALRAELKAASTLLI